MAIIRAKITVDIELETESTLFDVENLKATVLKDLQNSKQNYEIHNINGIEVCQRCGSKSLAERSSQGGWYCKRCYRALTDPKTPY